jgi:hypothetical protein
VNRPADAGQSSGGPINILTAVRSRWAWAAQKRKFSLPRLPAWVTRGFAGREPGGFTLKRLNILHSATWLRAGRFPRIEGCPRETHYWVLFCSNFAGPWDPYRQAFLDVLGKGVRTIWGTSIGFPKFPRRGSRYDLEDWVRYRLPDTDHYYRAYPGLSPNDVRGAVRLAREVEALAFSWRAARRPNDTEALRCTFERLVTRVQDCLGGVPEEALSVQSVLGPLSATGMSNLVSLMPILPGLEEDVRDRIQELPGDDMSPFRKVPGTHFARLAVLDRRTAAFHPAHTVTMRNSWLLLVVDFDGDFDDEERRARRMDGGEIRRYLHAVDEVAELRSVWRDCFGFRPNVALEDLLEPSVVERFVLFRDHGDTTLAQIRPALELKRQFVTLRGSGRLQTAEQIECFLAEVRDGIRDRLQCQLGTTDERYLARYSSQFHGA